MGWKIGQARQRTNINTMSWEQMLAALKSLCPTHLEMRAPGDWYVSAQGREVQRTGSNVLSGVYGNGSTVQAAVEDDWRKVVTDQPRDVYIVLNAMGKNRRHVRWNGYMWENVL